MRRRCWSEYKGTWSPHSSFKETGQFEPGWAAYNKEAGHTSLMVGTPQIFLGGYATSKGEGKSAVLIVRVKESLEWFSVTHPNLHLRINGVEQHLSPTSQVSECTPQGLLSYCEQKYIVPSELISGLATSDEVKIKVDLRTGTYAEGSLPPKGTKGAREGFAKLYQEMQSLASGARTPAAKK